MDALAGDEVKRKLEQNLCSPLLQARIRAGFEAVLSRSGVVGPQGFEPWTDGLKKIAALEAVPAGVRFAPD